MTQAKNTPKRFVDETSAAKQISAFIILNPKNELCATLRAHYGNSRVTVDLFAHGYELQQGRASGWGYDKFTAAIRGMVIDGIELNDHCGTNDKTKKLLSSYLKEVHKEGANIDEIDKKYRLKAEKIGARFANYQTYYFVDNDWVRGYNLPVGVNKDVIKSLSHWDNLYLESGLDKLRLLGYKVYQAI